MGCRALRACNGGASCDRMSSGDCAGTMALGVWKVRCWEMLFSSVFPSFRFRFVSVSFPFRLRFV